VRGDLSLTRGGFDPGNIDPKVQRSNGNVRWSPLDTLQKVGAGATAKLFLPKHFIEFEPGPFFPCFFP
jgi:hypothetical protein